MRGIAANHTRLARDMASSLGLATTLAPRIGYAVATTLAKDAVRDGRSIAEAALERGLVTNEELTGLLEAGDMKVAVQR